MASTNKTTNYELSQFEGTDKPSWEADYNADMLAIDTNLKAVSDVADSASGSLSTLADRVTTAEGNISTNANDIDALEARADALESGETIADGRLDALEAEQLIQNTAIEGNTQLGYNLARPYDSASTYAVGAYVLFQNTLYKCTTAVSTGEAFDPNKWLAIKATDEIGAGGSDFTITTLDNSNFSPTISSATGMIIGESSITISNAALHVSSSLDQNFIANMGDYNHVHFCINFSCNQFSTPANSTAQIVVEASLPAVFGNISNKVRVQTVQHAGNNKIIQYGDLTLVNDNTISLRIYYENNNSSAQTETNIYLFFDFAYVTNN